MHNKRDDIRNVLAIPVGYKAGVNHLFRMFSNFY